MIEVVDVVAADPLVISAYLQWFSLIVGVLAAVSAFFSFLVSKKMMSIERNRDMKEIRSQIEMMAAIISGFRDTHWTTHTSENIRSLISDLRKHHGLGIAASGAMPIKWKNKHPSVGAALNSVYVLYMNYLHSRGLYAVDIENAERLLEKARYQLK